MANVKSSMTALFNSRSVKKYIEEVVEERESKSLEALQFIGEEFVNRARNNRTYKDRTGNLRSSIGYIILYNGEVQRSNFSGKKSNKGREVANEVSREYPDGWVLIGVAGMEYAFHVEKNGYDVITGSAPVRNELIDIFNAI